MDTVVFVHGKLPQGAVPQGKDVQVIALDITASLALTAANIPHKTADKYPVPDSNKRAVDFLNEWSAKPVLDNFTIKDLLAHDGFSFWWCMEQWLYYSFLYRDPLNKIIEAIDVVQTVLKTERPKNVTYVNDGTLFSRVIPMLASNAKLQPIARTRPMQERFKEAIRPWGIQEFFRWHIRARRLIWTLQRPRHRLQAHKGKHVLAVCAYHWRMVEHPSLAKPMLGDPYITPIVDQLKGDAITYVDGTQREYVGFDALKRKAKSDQRHVLLEQYVSGDEAREATRAIKKLRHTAKQLERSPEFKSSWMLDGIDLWPLIAPQFRCYFARRLEGHLLDYVSVKALLTHEQPNLVIYPCEGGDLAYIFYKLSAERRIPSVGIQHGTMSYSPLTVHAKDEMCSGKPQCLPRPTKLLVYGPYYRDYLVEHGDYPKDELAVIGNLRYDNYGGTQKLVKKEMTKKYGFDGTKPIILYATQVMPTPKEGEEITRAVFRAAKELDLPLIVKQHPGEPSDAFYHTLAQEMGMSPPIIKHTSTLELITATDVMIGSESTLNYEAMILGKPIIILNFGGGRKDWMSFAQDGAALGVYHPEDVVPALKKALYDPRVRAELEEGMRVLFAAHCYRADGKAAERAVHIIKELLE
jgi:hypothetical protein